MPLAMWFQELRQSGRWVVLAAFLFAVGYSVAVLVTVATSGDVGLRCVFGTTIHTVDDYQWSARQRELAPELSISGSENATWSPTRPREGDTLLAIGPHRVRNYHEYVLAHRAVSRRAGQYVDILWSSSANEVVARGQVRVQTPPLGTYLWSVVWFLQEMIVFGVGAWVYWRRPRDESARLFFWLCLATVGAFMGGYHWTKIVVHRPLIYSFAAFAVFVPILSLHFYLVFPRTNPILLLHRRLVLTVLYGIPTVALAAMWGCMVWSTFDTAHVEWALTTLQALAIGYVWLSAGIFMLCLACLIYSFLRARSRTERNQVQWILLATLLALVPISYLLWDTWNAPERLGMTRSVWPMFAVSLLYTAAYATSITRYRLMQAEVFLSRGVLYFLVSLGAVLLYSGVLVVFTLLLGERIRPVWSVEAVVAGLTAIVILVLTELARHRFHRAIDRRFDREKSKFDVAMRKISRAVSSLVDRGTLARRLLEAIAEVLHLEWGAIYLVRGDADGSRPFTLIACQGPEPDEGTLVADNPLVSALRRRPGVLRGPHLSDAIHHDAASDALIALGGEIAVPLEVDGTLIGLVVLGPKQNGQRYEDDELAYLGALSSLAALAMRSAGIQATLESLNHDLRDKVDKIAEQQRRILVLQSQLADRDVRASRTDAQEPAAPAAASDTAAFSAIRGSSLAVRRMVELGRKVAASHSTVLIRGESGTGKELVAEAIHRSSPRAQKPFVQVHCAALSQNLLESELFGHVKGAFTGADRDRIGRFQQADGGTLFLDEIGDINWEVQTKLLRVLQEMSFERVGSSQTINVDVRLVTATNQDLEALIREGRFREDLYYRLNVFSLQTPPLRDRREDIFELAVYFLNRHAGGAGKAVSHLDESAVEALVAYDWPGNVRELENVIERAVVLSEGPAITRDDLPAEVCRPNTRRRNPRAFVIAASTSRASGSSRRRSRAEARDAARVRPPRPTSDGRTGEPPRPGFDEAEPETDPDHDLDAYEREHLVEALRDADGNKSLAARLLAMPRSTFFSKLKKHGLS